MNDGGGEEGVGYEIGESMGWMVRGVMGGWENILVVMR